ncbi:MAG: hypothetical protein M0Q13_07930 [Methanothrix sp.]|jgi:hypothetical protein|nr:hypothetical protein [Methanothrix sp.]
MILAKCNCKNKCQGLMYGKGMSVHNLMNGGKRHETTGYFEGRCVVCGMERRLD